MLYLVYDIRRDHPSMGSRDMYLMLKPCELGRDRFEAFCRENGLLQVRYRNASRTTDSRGVTRFDNLLIGLELTAINQVWVSDITYYEMMKRFYYLTFIMDAYSRRILGYAVSERLFTEQTTLPALEMAVRTRAGYSLRGCILHSDGGGQYFDQGLLKRTQELKMLNSMCEYPWENGKAERVNGIIKNNYLYHWKPSGKGELLQAVDRAVRLYNEEKPHSSLGKVTPITFETEYRKNLNQQAEPIMLAAEA